MFIPNNQYIENALKNGIPENALRFFRKRFDNANDDHVSTVRGTLSREEMISLKTRVDEIVRGYNELTKDSIMTKEQRDLSKVMYIYNYILGNVMYTQCQFAPGSSNVFGGNPHKNSVYGALVLHDAVCSGMSEAIDCLCKVMGVESTKLLSTPLDPWGGGHAFNSVKVGDTWYKVDAALEIGLNPGHKIHGGRWKDRSFLVPFGEQHERVCVPSVPNCIETYPRDRIIQMQHRLRDRGLSFEYGVAPQIVHVDIRNAVNSFLIKRIGSVNLETARNFEQAVEETFNITKRNGVYVAERREPVVFVEDANSLIATDNTDGVELYANGDSRFVIKSINGNQISGFTILRRNGEIESRLPASKWNPVDYNNSQVTQQNNYARRR